MSKSIIGEITHYCAICECEIQEKEFMGIQGTCRVYGCTIRGKRMDENKWICADCLAEVLGKASLGFAHHMRQYR